MSIRFTQKHIVKLKIGGLTNEQFLNVAVQTSRVLGWVFSSINDVGFTAHTSNGIFSWNAEVRFKIKSNGFADLQSSSMSNQVIEFGKNQENLQNFISVFNNLKKAVIAEEIMLQYNDVQQDVA